MEKTVARKASRKASGGTDKASASAEAPHAYRSHTCGALRGGDVGGTARLSGWVHRVRDHGGLLFIDLFFRIYKYLEWFSGSSRTNKGHSNCQDKILFDFISR
jgi:hypothetical protein